MPIDPRVDVITQYLRAAKDKAVANDAWQEADGRLTELERLLGDKISDVECWVLGEYGFIRDPQSHRIRSLTIVKLD